MVRSFYGPDCDADGIVESLHRVADEVFLSAPVPKKPGLDALLAWLDEQRLPMAVASSSREAMIRNNLDQWGMTHYFKVIVSGQHVAHSKPDPEIFLDDEMRSLYTMECASLDEVLEKLKNDQL